ncbi:MAG: DUF4384 domain-containing protein [Muribaculaceae bacterium]
MKLRKTILALAITLTPFSGFALKEMSVKREYTLYGDGSHSRDECKRLALEGARIEAIKSAFGTIVSQDIVQHDMVNDGGESTYFSAMSATEVKGEWIADDGEPKFTYSVDNDGNLVVKCSIKGRARELSNESTDFQTLVLRNGNEARFADTTFANGDDLKLLVKAPVDGFLAVFLVGEDRQTYALLPYLNDPHGEVKIKRGKEYVFFDTEKADSKHGPVDQLVLTSESPSEYNRIYVVFSPNKFSRAVDTYTDELTPRTLSFDSFNRWLAKCRKIDPKMGVKIINLQIKG